MRLPGPVAAAAAKVSALEDYHPQLAGVVLVVAAVLLIASGLQPGRRRAPK
jgi:hypothetical protein